MARAKRNAEDTLTNIRTSTPGRALLLQHAADRRGGEGRRQGGQVKIIGFDEDPVTLRGVADGMIDGTVVQQPFEFGYQSMIDIAKYIEGDKSVIPANGLDIIPTQIIDKNNVADFAAWTC